MSIFLPYQPEAGRMWKYWTGESFAYNLPNGDMGEERCGSIVSAKDGRILVPREVVCIRDKAADWYSDIPLYILEVAGALGVAGKLSLSADELFAGLGVPTSNGLQQNLDAAIQGAAMALSGSFPDTVVMLDKCRKNELYQVLVFMKEPERDAFLANMKSARTLFYKKVAELLVMGAVLPVPSDCNPNTAVLTKTGPDSKVVICRDLCEAVLYMRKAYITLKQRCHIAGVAFSGRIADDGMSFIATDENNTGFMVEIIKNVETMNEDEF